MKVRRRGSDTKFVASVLSIGTECDIAMCAVPLPALPRRAVQPPGHHRVQCFFKAATVRILLSERPSACETALLTTVAQLRSWKQLIGMSFPPLILERCG